MKIHSFAVRFGVLLAIVLGLQLGTVSTRAADEKLTNASIIELQNMSLGDAVILEKIKASKCDFDTSMAGLKQLKDAKISSAVIQAMIAAKSPAPAAAAATPATKGDPNDPLVQHASGVWTIVETNGVKKMVQLESEAAAAQTSGGGYGWGRAWGASSTSEAVVNGSEAGLQLADHKPVFYLYLGRVQEAAGQSDAAMEFATVQNPKEIVLAKFTVRNDKKRNERLLVTASHNAYAGTSLGIEAKAIRTFDFEKLADGIFKVTPKDDLADGEYTFTAAATRGHGRFFTFGITTK